MLVTLSLLNEKQNITEKEILETFDQSDVLKIFETFSEQRKRKIIEEIKAQKSEDKQIKSLLNFIDQLTLENDWKDLIPYAN